MIRVSGRVNDFPRNSDLAEELAALLEWDDDVALARDLHIVILWLCPSLYNWDGVNLDIEYKQRNAYPLQFLTKTCVVNVIVGGERVANLVEGHTHPFEIRLPSSKSSWTANVKALGPFNGVLAQNLVELRVSYNGFENVRITESSFAPLTKIKRRLVSCSI